MAKIPIREQIGVIVEHLLDFKVSDPYSFGPLVEKYTDKLEKLIKEETIYRDGFKASEEATVKSMQGKKCTCSWVGSTNSTTIKRIDKSVCPQHDIRSKAKIEPLVYDWDEVGSHLLKETVEKLNEVIEVLNN